MRRTKGLADHAQQLGTGGGIARRIGGDDAAHGLGGLERRQQRKGGDEPGVVALLVVSADGHLVDEGQEGLTVLQHADRIEEAARRFALPLPALPCGPAADNTAGKFVRLMPQVGHRLAL